MYGDTSFIHDGSDIEGVHPDAIRGNEGKKLKKVTVEEVEDEDDGSMTYLEDTEPRGYANLATFPAFTYHYLQARSSLRLRGVRSEQSRPAAQIPRSGSPSVS